MVKYTVELDYINYDDEDMEDPRVATAKKVEKNLHKIIPGVSAKVGHKPEWGDTVILTSSNLDALKHAWMYLTYGGDDAEYKQMVKNGTLEKELQGTDFYNLLVTTK